MIVRDHSGSHTAALCFQVPPHQRVSLSPGLADFVYHHLLLIAHCHSNINSKVLALHPSDQNMCGKTGRRVQRRPREAAGAIKAGKVQPRQKQMIWIELNVGTTPIYRKTPAKVVAFCKAVCFLMLYNKEKKKPLSRSVLRVFILPIAGTNRMEMLTPGKKGQTICVCVMSLRSVSLKQHPLEASKATQCSRLI